MIRILQTGQIGSTKHLVEMHRVRTKIFRDRMGWSVDVNEMELEIDDYDLPDTIYILAFNSAGDVVGTWRFLTTDQPSMIRNIWPQYLKSLPIPEAASICETSRFGVYAGDEATPERQGHINQATAEMIVALIDVCIKCGITDMFTLYNIKIKRLLERIGFKPALISEVTNLEGEPTVTAQFKMDVALLAAVRSKTGMNLQIPANELPPLPLEKFIAQRTSLGNSNALKAS